MITPAMLDHLHVARVKPVGIGPVLHAGAAAT